MRITLRVYSRAGQLERELDQTLCVLGRKDADVLLDDARCSRNHAVLYENEQGELYIKDLNSSNGTLVNGKPIEEQELEVGDEIRIGDVRIVLEAYVSNRSSTFVGNIFDILKKPLPPLPDDPTVKGTSEAPPKDTKKKKSA